MFVLRGMSETGSMSVTIEKSAQMDVQIRLFINNLSTKLNHLPKVCHRFGEKFSR